MKKVFKFVKGRRDERREPGRVTPSQSGELFSPAQTPEEERFLALENFLYAVDFSGKDKTLTKLHKAAWQGNLEKLKSALKKVDVDAVDQYGRTALHFAVAQGHPNIVWFLLGNNAKTYPCDADGCTPLLKAVECGHKECLMLLLERSGEETNVPDYEGNACLHFAVAQGCLDTASALLAKGAKTEAKNSAGDRPLHVATRMENKDAAELLLSSGASVDAPDREHRTPLMLAAKSGNLPLARLFVERGAQPTAVDSNGWSAQDYAMLFGHEQVAAFLKKPPTEDESSESSSLADSGTEGNGPGDPETENAQKVKEVDKSADEAPKGEEPTDSPETQAMPPYCQPPRSWEIIQAGMIDENEKKRRTITALGTLRSRRESFTEGSGAASPKSTLSLNRRKADKGGNSFAKQRFSFNEESLRYWTDEEKTIRKDLEKIEFENMLNLEEMVNAPPGESTKGESLSSDGGTLGRTGTMHAVDEMWVANPRAPNSWDSEEAPPEREAAFPPPPTALELGADMAKSIKYTKGVSVDQPGGVAERNLWRKARESHSLDAPEEKPAEEGKARPSDVSRRISEQLECYDQALRELAESSAPADYHSLPSGETAAAPGEGRRTSSRAASPDSGPLSLPYIPAEAIGGRPERKSKRHMLLAMREVKHAVHVANTFKTSVDDQILSPLTKPEGSFDVEEKPPSGESEGASPAEENPFFALGRQETVLERRRKSSSSGEEPTLWLQDDRSEEEAPQMAADEGRRPGCFSPLGVVHRELQEESRRPRSGGAEEGEAATREQSPDVSLSSGPIEPLATERDSGSEPESSHNDVTPTHDYALKNQHEWLKSHLKTATSEKNKLEEVTAQLSEKAERLQYELADAKEAAKSRDEVIQLLQGQLARMEAAYTKSLEEAVQSRLQLTSHEQEILHLKELCFKYEEEKEGGAGDVVRDLQGKIKALEEEKERMRKEILHLEELKASLEKRLKEAADAEILDQCQRWKERCTRLEELALAFDSKQAAFESQMREKERQLLEQREEIKQLHLELGDKCLKACEDNIEFQERLKRLLSELEQERRKESQKEDTEEVVARLRRKNLEMEAEMRKLEKEAEEKVIRKLREKEDEVRELERQFDREREALVAGYERKLLEGRSESMQSLADVVQRLQDQVTRIQTKAAGGALQGELAELKDQWELMSRSIAEVQDNDRRLDALLQENRRLRKEAAEGETARTRTEILELRNQVNGLRMLLCGRDRQESQRADDAGGRRRAGKEDELAWSHLYGIKSSRRGDRSGPADSQLEFLELKKEILALQTTVSDEKASRQALEGQIVTMHLDLNEKENLDKEMESLRRKVSRNCVQRSELELLQHQRDLEAKREKFSGAPETRGPDDGYKAKCERLAREREKFRSRRSKSFDPGGALWTCDPPDALPCPRSQPVQAAPLAVHPQPVTLPPQLKTRLEEELDKSIRKYAKETAPPLSNLNLELVKKKYLQ